MTYLCCIHWCICTQVAYMPSPSNYLYPSTPPHSDFPLSSSPFPPIFFFPHGPVRNPPLPSLVSLFTVGILKKVRWRGTWGEGALDHVWFSNHVPISPRQWNNIQKHGQIHLSEDHSRNQHVRMGTHASHTRDLWSRLGSPDMSTG